MKPELLLAWWNLVYIAPFFVALLYLVLYCVSGLTFGEDLAVEGQDIEQEVDVDHDVDVDADAALDIDADADLDHDVDVDHEVDVDQDADVDHDVDADHDADVDQDAEMETPLHGGVHAAHAAHDVDYDAHATPVDHAAHVGQQAARDQSQAKPEAHVLFRALSWLGVGRVPLSILLMVLCFSWGFIGFATNNLLVNLPIFSAVPALVVLVSIPIAVLGSTTLTRSTAGLLGKWLPTTETYARSHRALVGSVGEALYPIDHKFGMAIVRDPEGTLHQVTCCVYEDAKPLAKGTRVLLVDYNDKDQHYWVIESDL